MLRNTIQEDFPGCSSILCGLFFLAVVSAESHFQFVLIYVNHQNILWQTLPQIVCCAKKYLHLKLVCLPENDGKALQM